MHFGELNHASCEVQPCKLPGGTMQVAERNHASLRVHGSARTFPSIEYFLDFLTWIWRQGQSQRQYPVRACAHTRAPYLRGCQWCRPCAHEASLRHGLASRKVRAMPMARRIAPGRRVEGNAPYQSAGFVSARRDVRGPWQRVFSPVSVISSEKCWGQNK